ncbi:MAG: acetyl-CoA carboxylase, carboxyltransferase subunit beta [Hydrogeniiclostridium sp.]
MLRKSNFKKSRNQLEGFSPNLQTDKPYVPQELCTSCPSCKAMLFQNDLEENNGVCPKCGYHFRLSARQRIGLICDENTYEPWDENLTPKDPLSFPGYGAKLKASRLRSRELEGVLTGKASVGGVPCAIFAMDAGFMMGSMGSVIGEKITRLFERAVKEKLPVIGFTVSGGARMQEGILSLMQMAKTSGAVKLHSDAGLLYITVLTDPTTGGVTASFAMEGDIILSEPGVLIAFAGPRVIEQTMRQKLPKGFQTAEFLLEKGFVDAVVPRKELRDTLSRLLRLHCGEV